MQQDAFNYTPKDVNNDFIQSQNKTHGYPVSRANVAAETNLVFSEVVTLIMDYEIQSHFSPSVHREMFSLKQNP